MIHESHQLFSFPLDNLYLLIRNECEREKRGGGGGGRGGVRGGGGEGERGGGGEGGGERRERKDLRERREV